MRHMVKFGHWGTRSAHYHSKYKGFKLYREVEYYRVPGQPIDYFKFTHSWFGVLDGRDEPLHVSTRDALKGMINEFWGKLA